MECRNCELRQRQFYCRTCIKTHLRDFQSQHGHYSTDLSSVVSSASVALTNTVQPARSARARVAEVRGRIDEAVAGLGGIKRECDKKRDRIRKLREDLAQRRRTLGAARILVKAGAPTSPPNSAIPQTPKSAPFLSTPLPDAHTFQPDTSGPPHLPPSPAHLALTQTLARARSGLVQELVDVFHIVEVGGRPPVGGKAGTKGEWTIGGLVLPVPGDIRRYPPDHINAVLTLTIHFLSLLSFYLGIKLPFAVSWTGGKLGLGQPWIGAIRGGSAGGGDGGWGRWHKKHPLHLTGQAARAVDKDKDKDKGDRDRPPSSSGDNSSESDEDDDPMASSVRTIKATSKRPTLPAIDTNPPRARTQSTSRMAVSSRPGPTPLVSSPLASDTPRRATTLSFTSAFGAVRKGVGGVVSAGAGVVGYGSPLAPARSRTTSTALDESAFLVRSPLTPTPTSPPPPRTTHTSSHRKPPDAPSNTQTQTHLTPSTAPPSFTTGYTMLIYNVCYLAHTQRVAPEIGLSQAGEVLSNLWRCCCSAELGRVGHESVGWGSSAAWAATTMTTMTSPTTSATSPEHEGGGGALTLVRLPPPTPPTFAMDFGQLLQAVSGAGGAGARAKTKMARRKGYSETMPGGVVEEEGLEEEGYENLNGESVMRDLRGGTQAQRTGTGTGSKDRDRDGVDPFKDDWDLVDEDVSF